MGLNVQPNSRRLSRWPTVLLLAAGMAVCGLILWQTAYWARQFALDQIRERGVHTISLLVENLRGELAKFQYQPKLLSENPLFHKVLKGEASPQDLTRLNLELERVNNVSGALDTYLMNAAGLTVAASNYASPRTFIGRNYSYRPYFQQAMEGRLGRYFALGTVSGERGYYFAAPVSESGSILGVIVVKVRVGHLEPAWRTADHEVAVVDDHGVIFLSSSPDWRFRTLSALPADTMRQLDLARKYGTEPLRPLHISSRTEQFDGTQILKIAQHATPEDTGTAPRGADRSYLVQSADMLEAGWTVMLFSRTDAVGGQITAAIAIAGFMLASLLLAGANLYQRRRRLAERIAVQESARAELEARVTERTDELTSANIKLTNEVGERRRAEAELRRTQADLVQASKLAALGQMSAGLSHELNQPLAAIRSYADNARAFLDRDKPAIAKKNLSGISELTERMARIIKNLRTYARDEQITLRPTPVTAALHEALALLDQRIRSENILVHTSLPAAEVHIAGGAVRLQQVFVNLISNALDAMADSADKTLEIRVETGQDQVAVTVVDTGPGIDEEQIGSIFDPFFSTKDVGKGMGLGLSITYGIVKQFGGGIQARNGTDHGAEFTLTFPRIGASEGEAA